MDDQRSTGSVKIGEYVSGAITLEELNTWAVATRRHTSIDGESQQIAAFLRQIEGDYGDRLLQPTISRLRGLAMEAPSLSPMAVVSRIGEAIAGIKATHLSTMRLPTE